MDVSVVCPFYNESPIIETAIRRLLSQLESLEGQWEVIVVNDGSTDGSEQIARSIDCSRLTVLGYAHNRGRGCALRTGIASARGDIVVTTEIDLSWGDTIVHDLVREMRRDGGIDIVVASPHRDGGGYRNVPSRRIWISRFGNLVIRTLMANAVTMNTGMTRAYRRQLIQSLPLTEDGKEFHLEVILKATAFGARIVEIPATLEWKEYTHEGQRLKRKSSSRMRQNIVSHSLFSVFAHPVRYVLGLSVFTLALGVVAFFAALTAYLMHMVAAFLALLSVSLIILGLIFFTMAVILHQGWMIQKELWTLQRAMKIDAGANALTSNGELKPPMAMFRADS
ncbi:MAG: glycosyltransferase family 2 protein [Gemmatimonadota bacterium]|nr:glycosyltransferase family 2 protein [Gemmatimonadota bacterium]